MSDNKPLLIFSQPRTVAIQGRGFPHESSVRFPARSQQTTRLAGMFEDLEQAFNAQRMELQLHPVGTVPEQVLVLESIGSVEDFANAVRRTRGMEWLVELEDDLLPDEEFFDTEQPDKVLDGQVYLVMTNQTAMRQLRSLWAQYNNNPEGKWPYGLTRWRDLFDRLRNIRPWNVQDRLRDTGLLEDLQERIAEGQRTAKFEAELWYRGGEIERRRSSLAFARRVVAEGGRILAEAIRPEIQYHGVVGEVPIEVIIPVLTHSETFLDGSAQVMFFRPVGQTVAPLPEDDAEDGPPDDMQEVPQGEPIVALFDGFPLQNHELLSKRLILDDPDGWEIDYSADDRNHGTAMASLILHGELDAKELPMDRPIYVRPILRTDPADFRTPREEAIPEEILPADLMFRAVKRMFEGEGPLAPVAPTVRIINLSVGDASRQFDRFLSPWARMLDWLSWKFRILFIVSVGNYLDDLVLDVPRTDLGTLTPEQLESAVTRAMVTAAPYRRLLAPSEAVNVLTVGALHIDSSPVRPLGRILNPFTAQGLPSPINRVGSGFRWSVKPDLLLPGGQQTYLEKLGTSHDNATLRLNRTSLSPGQSVASPGTAGSLRGRRYSRGTSNATAIGTRAAAQIYDALGNLRATNPEASWQRQHEPVLLKAMLVHGASWGDNYAAFMPVLSNLGGGINPRENATRFLGYGSGRPTRVLSCIDQRATIIGWGDLRADEANYHSLPLPACLTGPQRTWRRLTVTLAWLTPGNVQHRYYRRARLWFEHPEGNLLRVDRKEVTWYPMQRGSVQHDILEGESAVAYPADATIEIKVNCRAYAGTLEESVPYALVVSLEVAEEIALPIYDEVAVGIRPRTPVVVAT